jgi:hypothetical protein
MNQPQWVQSRAAITKARKGAAAVFFHDQLDGNPDTLAWHAGCVPLSGDKWTMQKFKELPTKFRKKRKKLPRNSKNIHFPVELYEKFKDTNRLHSIPL